MDMKEKEKLYLLGDFSIEDMIADEDMCLL